MKGSVRKRGDTYGYVVDIGYDSSTGKRKQKRKSGFRTKKEAQKACNELIALLNRGDFVDTKKITFEAFAREWMVLKESQYKPSTYSVYVGIIENRLIPQFGHGFIHMMKAADVQTYYNKMLRDGRTAKYIRLVHNILRVMMKDAVVWEYATKNIMDVIEPPKLQRSELEVWSLEEAKRFLEEAKNVTTYYPFFFMAIWTGMRKGEIFGLKWKDIDMEKKTITIQRTLTWTRHKKTILQDTKTKGSRRTIQVPDSVLTILKEQRSRQKQQLLKNGIVWDEDKLVFLTRNGLPVSDRHPATQLAKISKLVGIKRIRIHDLRHTHATISLGLGQHPKIVSERLGHTTISITLDLYSHVSETMQQQSMDQIEKAMLE